MAKIALADIVSGFASTAALNANNTAIEAALENTLSRDGTGPNYMTSDLDLNGNRILNQGNPITVEGFNWEGPWVTATAYIIGDVVENSNSSYIAVEAHTSGVFATDLGAGKWQVVASSAALPSQSGNNGKLLTTDGAAASWIDVSTLYLPLSGGTLAGALTGTSISLSGSATIAGNVTVDGNTTTVGTGTYEDVIISDNLDVAGLITPSQTKGIKGTTTNNSANAGSVGEYVLSNIASSTPVSLTSATAKNVTSIILTAGDWDIDGTVHFIYGATTNITSLFGGASIISNTIDSYTFSHRCAPFVPGSAPMGYTIPPRRLSIASTTVVYLVAVAGFTVSTCSAYGYIQARRIR